MRLNTKIKLFFKILIVILLLGFANPNRVTTGTAFISTSIKNDPFNRYARPNELFSYEQFPDLYCLAMNIYHEARDEPMASQLAVADVVLNRVEHRSYPNTVCEVVKEGPVRESWKTKLTSTPDDAVFYPVLHKCQFSWYCDGKPDNIDEDEAWRKAQYYAYLIYEQHAFRGITEGATHYHADYVNPHWAPYLIFIGRIGTHYFYRQR